ncbi:MAG: PIN domain-containing protein [Polaromonas sp.]
MSHLIDANVISELVSPKPDAAVLDWFGPRILPIGPDVADLWGRLLAQAGRPVPAIDSLLVATALHHDLRLVTRNTRDFDYAGLEVINPWKMAVD